MPEIPIVFISYSWSNNQHIQKVVELAQRLISHGVDVVLDRWSLKEGQDKYLFMEQCVSNPDICKVLIICDEAYTQKADARKGGVGDETAIITPSIYGKGNQEKYIPIVFEKDKKGTPFLPAYLKSRLYFDLSTDEKYESEYEKLLRNILDKPLEKKPALGKIPVWIEDNDSSGLFSLCDILKQIKHADNNSRKFKYLVQQFEDEYILAASTAIIKGVPTGEKVVKAIEQLKPVRDIYVDFLEAIYLQDACDSDILATIIEHTHNELFSIQEDSSSRYIHAYEPFDFLIWEMFLCTIAFLYRYKEYQCIYNLTAHTYYLNHVSSEEAPRSYQELRPYIQTIEEDYKPKSSQPNLISMMGEILVHREYFPYITQDSISFADILLAQLSNYGWYPMAHPYANPKKEWVRLSSKKFCDGYMIMFGVSTYEDFRRKVSSIKTPQDMSFRPWRHPNITGCIGVEQIAILP